MVHVLAHMPFAATVEQAATSFAFMAEDLSLEGIGGRFYGELHELAASPEARDDAKARRFWELATALVGAPPWSSLQPEQLRQQTLV